MTRAQPAAPFHAVMEFVEEGSSVTYSGSLQKSYQNGKEAMCH